MMLPTVTAAAAAAATTAANAATPPPPPRRHGHQNSAIYTDPTPRHWNAHPTATTGAPLGLVKIDTEDT